MPQDIGSAPILVLGDAHADKEAHRETLLATYEQTNASVALQVGDLQYYDLPVPTWFVAGKAGRT